MFLYVWDFFCTFAALKLSKVYFIFNRYESI